jgi:hypothetical protein
MGVAVLRMHLAVEEGTERDRTPENSHPVSKNMRIIFSY